MMNSEQNISQAVEQLYDTYPFPPESLLDEPPPGYNWRWNWPVAYSFCTGQKPTNRAIRILDAGCGTGVGTDYLVHLNPEANVTAIDLSSGALKVAKERCQRSGANRVTFHHLSIYDVANIEGEFDLINCVGVLHHLPDPIRGIKALASKLAPGGLFHIFVYAELGRWEIQLMQQAIALLQNNSNLDQSTGEQYQEGVKIGRQIFAALPETNRILKREKERWSMENHRDASFADMYVHPQEVDYNINTLFEFIDAAELQFLGFSNVDYWNLERLLGKEPELIKRARQLSDRQQYRLIELLDPDVTHYEFFLTRPPLAIADWSNDETLNAAYPELSPCLHGWPSSQVFDYNYQIVNLSPTELEFLNACDSANSSDCQKTVAELIANLDLDLDGVRSLQKRQLILLSAYEG